MRETTTLLTILRVVPCLASRSFHMPLLLALSPLPRQLLTCSLSLWFAFLEVYVNAVMQCVLLFLSPAFLLSVIVLRLVRVVACVSGSLLLLCSIPLSDWTAVCSSILLMDPELLWLLQMKLVWTLYANKSLCEGVLPFLSGKCWGYNVSRPYRRCVCNF